MTWPIQRHRNATIRAREDQPLMVMQPLTHPPTHARNHRAVLTSPRPSSPAATVLILKLTKIQNLYYIYILYILAESLIHLCLGNKCIDDEKKCYFMLDLIKILAKKAYRYWFDF